MINLDTILRKVDVQFIKSNTKINIKYNRKLI